MTEGSTFRTMTLESVPSGYYTLMLSLSDGATPDPDNTLVDSVRMVTNNTTSGTVVYPSLSGAVSLTFRQSALMTGDPLYIDSFTLNGQPLDVVYPGDYLWKSTQDTFYIQANVGGVLSEEGALPDFKWYLFPSDGSRKMRLSFLAVL